MKDENVVSFGEAKLKRTRGKHCDHKNLTYDYPNRIVHCDDCARQIDAFDAFMVLVDQHAEAHSELRRKLIKADDLNKARIYTDAARNLGKAWSGKQVMAVSCPHCDRGLLPEDFSPSIGSATCREWEIAKRRRDKDPK